MSALDNETGKGSTHINQVEGRDVHVPALENAPEIGESLLLRRTLLKPTKEENIIAQRRALCKTICKSRGECYQVIIDRGNTDNLVSTEMVAKLSLKKVKHPNPYKVS